MNSPPHLFSREDEQYIFQGNCTSIDFQQLESSLYADAATILCRDLLLQPDQSCLHTLDLATIRDQGLLNAEHGYSFLKDNDVSALPIVYLPHFEQRYCTSVSTQYGAVRTPDAAVQKYESNARAFLECLILLLLLDGKQPDGLSNFHPVDAPELPSLRIENSIRGIRNIVVMGQNVMISTTSKNLDCNIRAINAPVGKLMVLYLACVRPFLARLSPQSPTATSDFLFPLRSGPWDTHTYLNNVIQQSRLRINKHLTLQDLNAVLVRYVEKIFPDNFTPEMREWLMIDQNRSISPVFQSFEQSVTPELLTPYGPSSPLAHDLSSLHMAELPTSSFSEIFMPEPRYIYQPLPLATPFKQEFKQEWTPAEFPPEYGFPWTAASPTPSTASESHALPTPQSMPQSLMLDYGRKRQEPVIRLHTDSNFVDSTPKDLAQIFRPHGNDKNHKLLFVRWEQPDKKSNNRGKPTSPKRITQNRAAPKPAWQSAVPLTHQQIRVVPNTRGRPRRII